MVADLSRSLSQTSRHVEMVCVRDFRDLCRRLSPKTSWFHDLSPFVSATFMICVHDFPHGEVLVKVGVMEFGLFTAWLMLFILDSCMSHTGQVVVSDKLIRSCY